MVDFQSRDTRRGPPLDDDDDEDEPDEADAEGASQDETPAEETGDGEKTDERPGSAAPDRTADSASTDEPEDDTAETTTSSSPEEAQEPSTEIGVDDGTQSTERTDANAPADPLEDHADASSPVEHAEAARDDETAAESAAETPETAVDVAVVTVGGGLERVEETIAAVFESAGHAITVRERLRGEYDTLQQVVDRLVGRSDVDVVVTTGGIGIAEDEVTIEAVHPLFEKALPGFGEAFRALLFEEIGTGIVAVRSTAGVADGTLVFCLPGDTAAGVAVEEILVPEAPELVAHLQ